MFLKISVIFIITFIPIVVPAEFDTIPDWKNYLFNLTQQFINELEDYGLCNLILKDFSQNIMKDNFFGYSVHGNVTYTNGFIGSMQEASIIENGALRPGFSGDRKANSAELRCRIALSSLIIYYDFYANLEEAQIKGTVAMPYRQLLADLTITKFYTTQKIVTNFKSISYDTAPKVWEFEPSSIYTDIINREMVLDIRESVEEFYSTTFVELMDKALISRPFPDICYLCD